MKKQKMSKEAKAMIKKVGNQINHQFDSQKGEEEMNENTEFEEVTTTEVATTGKESKMRKVFNMKNIMIAAAGLMAIGAVAYGIVKISNGESTDDMTDAIEDMADAMDTTVE